MLSYLSPATHKLGAMVNSLALTNGVSRGSAKVDGETARRWRGVRWKAGQTFVLFKIISGPILEQPASSWWMEWVVSHTCPQQSVLFPFNHPPVFWSDAEISKSIIHLKKSHSPEQQSRVVLLRHLSRMSLFVNRELVSFLSDEKFKQTHCVALMIASRPSGWDFIFLHPKSLKMAVFECKKWDLGCQNPKTETTFWV